MIDAGGNCPTVPRAGTGTVGQHAPMRDSARDGRGTGWLKRLAGEVLSRDMARDIARDATEATVPASPGPAGSLGTATGRVEQSHRGPSTGSRQAAAPAGKQRPG